MRFLLSSTLAIGLAYGPVNAATFDIFFWDTSATNPTTGQPISNINDAELVTVGSISIDDSAIAPNAFVELDSGNVSEFSVTYTDRDGIELTFDYFDDDTSRLDSADFGVLFDAAGNFQRFDSPIFTFSNSTTLVDDESPNPSSGFIAAFLTIFDDDDLSFGYLNEPATFNSTNFATGDFVDPALFPNSDVTIFTNAWEGTGRDVDIDFSGFITVQERAAGVSPVPLPASGIFLFAGLGLFGVLGRRRTS